MKLGDHAAKAPPDAESELKRLNAKLAKINAALMQRVERSMDHQANAYSMFQTAISLETQVRLRTEELKNALHRLERANDDLTTARDAAERAHRFKTRFFTAVGHDLLQPLHAARLTLSAMAEGSGQEAQRRLIDRMDHSLSSIEELLRTILDLSRLEAGATTPSIQTVPLRELFCSLVLDLEPIARSKGLPLSIRPSDALVFSDPLMLRRILQNLVANAVHYADTGRVLLAARRRGDFVRLDVWDMGPGIAPAEREIIFDEFQRGSAAEKSRGGGFGIGLSIIGRMAEALSHKIEFCTRVGSGTRFSVFVPFAGTTLLAPAPAASGAAALQSYGLAGTRAIVIDNDIAVLDAMRPLLERWGCDARFVLGLEDIERLVADEPDFRADIILADYHLGRGQCGLAAVSRLRDATAVATPAVVITADHSSQVASEVINAGCEILRKPIRPAELRSLIVHLLG